MGGVILGASDLHLMARPDAPPVQAFLDAAASLLRQTDARVLFLATDNRAVQDLWLRRFGESRVICTPKWLPEPGKALHLGSGSPDPRLSARDALLDILLLAACDDLVTLGNSSFSAAARLFSRTPEDQRRTLFGRLRPWQRLLSRIGRIRAGLRQEP